MLDSCCIFIDKIWHMKYNVKEQHKTIQNIIKQGESYELSSGNACVAPPIAVINVSGENVSEETTEVTTEGGNSKILVAAAASLQATFDNELIPLFEKENPEITVEGTYASSGDLQQQIESGLDADVFFSAATSNMDTLAEEKLIDEDTVVDLLKNNIVLITPKDSKLGIKSFKDITKADTIAIGDPESVPAGKYAKEILTNLGVYNEVEKKASLGASVTEVLSWVAEGSADAGIVYAQNGKKYIVVILANRPHNAPQGKDFIVKASSLIYKAIVGG